jgi:hypothetical protein
MFVVFPMLGAVVREVKWVTAGGYRPSADVGIAYSDQLQATSLLGPVSYSLVSGSLPAGLSLSAAGTITGTPSEATNLPFTVRAFVTGDPAVYKDREFGIASKDVPGMVVTSSTSVFRSTDMTTWTSSPVPKSAGSDTAYFMSPIGYGNGKYVMVGTDGFYGPGHYVKFFTSEDAVTWVETFSRETLSGDVLANVFKQVLYGNGKFLMLGGTANKHHFVSTDGITWTPAGTQQMDGGCFAKGMFVTFYRDMLYTTTDGVTFTKRFDITLDQVFRNVVYNETHDLFFGMMSNGYGYKSSDGITWTNVTHFSMIAAEAMGTVGGVFWIQNGTNAYFSTDLTNWTTKALGYNVVNIVSDGVSMIGLATTGTTGASNRVVSTTDGVTFVTSPTVTAETGGLYRIAVKPQD